MKRDESLAVPPFDGPPGAALSFEGAPVREVLEPRTRCTLDGRTASASLSHDEGLVDLTIANIEVLHGLRITGAVPLNGVLTSAGAERMLDIGGVAFVERTAVSNEHPLFVAEWVATDATAQNTPFTLQYVCSPNTPVKRWNSSARAMLIETGDAMIFFAFDHTTTWDVEIHVDRDGRADMQITASISSPTQTLRMIATASRSIDEVVATARAAADFAARNRAHVATQRRRHAQGVAVSTPDPHIDAALDWARQRIVLADTSSFLGALGALACGSFDVARSALLAFDDDDPLFLILMARYHAWTADTAAVLQQWRRVQRTAALCIAELNTLGRDDSANVALHQIAPQRIALVTTALDAIAATAGDIGQAAFAHDVVPLVKRTRSAHAAALRTTHWLAALPSDGVADKFTGDVVDTWLAYERGGVMNPPLPPARHAYRDPAAFAVLLVCGMLGIEPEAARNRLRIRLQTPDTWDRIGIRHVRMEDTTVSLEYTRSNLRDGVAHHFTAHQDAGAIPVRLILEPVLRASEIRSASVDGITATLDPHPFGARMIVPIQIVLDERRVIEIITAG